MILKLSTQRLTIEALSLDDAEFTVELLNDELFKKNIGDKQVNSVSDAKNYLREGPLASYQTNGYGLLKVSLSNTNQPIGICGLIKRPSLNLPDIGFAFLSQFCRSGYGYESCCALLKSAYQDFNLTQLLAITNINNFASQKLLVKLGFCLQEVKKLADIEAEQQVYSIDLAHQFNRH